MKKNKRALNKKKNDINVMIKDLSNNKRAIKRVGGHTIKTLGGEIEFHKERKKILDWAENKTEIEIITKIKELENTLPQAEKDCKYGVVVGLARETILTISKIELLELTIDEHGKHKGGWK